MKQKVAILICSYEDSKYLGETLRTINETTTNYELELRVDIEGARTGLENTPNRYYELFKDTSADIVVKSDDDVRYFSGWLEECIEVLKEPEVAYVCPMSHKLLPSLSTDTPVYRTGYTLQPFAGGLCWVFKRELWELVPYNICHLKTLDSFYGRLVRDCTKKSPAYLNSILCSHLGTDRHGGIDIE